MLERQIKNIMAVLELQKKGLGSKAISESLKLHEYTVKLCIKYGNAIKAEKLHRAFNSCLDTELDIKSGKMPERLAMEMLLVNLFE
jgi:DNA polymerase-3 subunit delta